jgi:Holliday junction DNA helicase RuvA
MISYIKGKILKKNEKFLIINTGNLGYTIHINKKLLSTINSENELELFIHSHIKEDAFDLYGFSNYEDLEFFKTLISVSGIGPKVALEILNTDINEVKSAILNEDTAFISKTPGIGAKTAKRLILELKDKIPEEHLIRGHQTITKTGNEDIISALTQIGFQRQEIVKTLEKIPKEIKGEEEIIQYFLKNS